VVSVLSPEAPAWRLILVVAGCAVAADGFFWLYQWAGWPVKGYIDTISMALHSLLAILLLLAKWSRAAGTK
jgi:hypothetical protein